MISKGEAQISTRPSTRYAKDILLFRHNTRENTMGDAANPYILIRKENRNFRGKNGYS
jgi:hypothetical protein